MKRVMIAAALVVATQTATASTAIDERAAMAEGAILEVVSTAGSVEISGWNRREIEVTGRLGEEAEELIFEPGKDRVLVKVEYKDKKDHDNYRGPATELVIKVPRSTNLRVKTVSADVGVKEIVGNQRIRTVSGDITARIAGEEAELRTVSGDVLATGDGKAREVTLYAVSGDVTARNLAGEVWAEAVSGDLEITTEDASEIHLKTVSGDIEAQLGLMKDARVHMESVSGDVDARLPANYSAEYELSSFSGDIKPLMDRTAMKKSKYAPGSELTFTHGDGKARVRVNTLSGDIDVSAGR